MAEHKNVLVKWKDQEGQIDKGIAPLILELWKAGHASDSIGSETNSSTAAK
jgi:hypothetical protein